MDIIEKLNKEIEELDNTHIDDFLQVRMICNECDSNCTTIASPVFSLRKCIRDYKTPNWNVEPDWNYRKFVCKQCIRRCCSSIPPGMMKPEKCLYNNENVKWEILY